MNLSDSILNVYGWASNCPDTSWSVVLQTERSIFFLDWVSLLKTMLIVCSIRSFWFKKSVMLASAFDYGETGTLYV